MQPPKLLQKLYDDLEDNIKEPWEPHNRESSYHLYGYKYDLFNAICSGGWVSNRQEPFVSLDSTTIKYKKSVYPGNQTVAATKPGWELKVECIIERDVEDMTTLQDWEFSLYSDGDYILNLQGHLYGYEAGQQWMDYWTCAYERRPICSVDEDYTEFLKLLPDFWVYENY